MQERGKEEGGGREADEDRADVRPFDAAGARQDPSVICTDRISNMLLYEE